MIFYHLLDTIGESKKSCQLKNCALVNTRTRFVTDKVQVNLEKETRGRARENNEAQEVLEILTQILLQS